MRPDSWTVLLSGRIEPKSLILVSPLKKREAGNTPFGLAIGYTINKRGD